MRILYLFQFFLCFFLMPNLIHSQSQICDGIKIDESDYLKNIHEVYGVDFFNDKPSLKIKFIELQRDRICIQKQKETTDEKYIKLSNFTLLKKYNTNLESSFSVNDLNPLKFDLPFFSNKLEVFRIDNSDFLLLILPQKNN